MGIGNPSLVTPQMAEPLCAGVEAYGFTGTPFFLLNTDAHTTDTDRPYNFFGGNASFSSKVMVIPNPKKAPYLDLYLHAAGTAAAATACTVKAYGYSVGRGMGLDIGCKCPTLVPGFHPTLSSSFHNATDFVHVLEDPVTGDTSITFATTDSALVSQPETSLPTNVSHIGGAVNTGTQVPTTPKSFVTSKRRSVCTAGADFVCVLVTTADDRATVCLVGRFVG